MNDPTGAAAVDAAVAALKKRPDCPPTKRYLVGVSGGRDSVVLLQALVRGGYKRLVACHLDHGIRGNAARADARFVEKLADELGLEFRLKRVDVRAEAAARKLSLETAARDARKEFFFEVAAALRCRNLLLAHHADDQVETVLFNLCRGTGAVGLGGMPLCGEWTAHRGKLRKLVTISVIRPLLGVWRKEIDAYVDEHRIRYREDATNTDSAHTRNRVRHEIVPALSDVLGRDVSQHIWRAADIISAEELLICNQLTVRMEQAAASIQLDCKELAKLFVAEQRRILRAWLRARGCPAIGYVEVERTRSLLDVANGPAKINLPAGLCARRRSGLLFVEPAGSKSS